MPPCSPRLPAGPFAEALQAGLSPAYFEIRPASGTAEPSVAAQNHGCERINLPHLEDKTPLDRKKIAGAIYPTRAPKGGRSPEQHVYTLYLRSANWKYVFYPRAVEGKVAGFPWKLHHIVAEPPLREQGTRNLYDLTADPHEFNDLSADPGQRERIADFHKELLD